MRQRFRIKASPGGWLVAYTVAALWAGWQMLADIRHYALIRDSISDGMTRMTCWGNTAVMAASALLCGGLALYNGRRTLRLRRRRRKGEPGHCRSCGYSLTGNASG